MTQTPRDADDAGITEAWTETNRRITLEEIDDHDIYAEHLHKKWLRDELLREVGAVRKSERAKAYFRLRPGYQDGARVDRGENNPLHDRTVRHLHTQLLRATSLEVRTSIWAGQGKGAKPADHTLWQSNPLRKLTWKCDPLTRVWLDRHSYFQPDLSAFDPVAAYPGPNNPWIIIEVVHHHWPDETAWNALCALSKANHLVLFYFVKDGKHNNWVNRGFGGDPYVLHVTFYLRDGDLYENNTRIEAPAGVEEKAAWIELDVHSRKERTLAR